MSEPAAPPPTPIESWEVLDLLTNLVQKSLVLYEEDEQGQGRYSLLEPMRQYARDRLAETGEGQALCERHLLCFLALAEQAAAESQSPGAQQVVLLERLERELDNFRAALAWSRAQGQARTGLRLGSALGALWHMRGYFIEAREHLAGLLAVPGAEARTAARAQVLESAGVLAQYQGDYAAARSLRQESLAIRQELGDRAEIAWSLWSLGHLARCQQDYEAARAFFEASLAIRREIGDKADIGSSLEGLGEVAHLQGANGEAWSLFEQSLSIARELGHQNGIAWRLYHLGTVALGEGDVATARAYLVESLALFQELGHKRGIVYVLEGLAAASVAQGQWERGSRLVGAVSALCAAIGFSLSPADRAKHDHAAAAARAALGKEAFAAAWAEGRAMSLEHAIQYAMGHSDA